MFGSERVLTIGLKQSLAGLSIGEFVMLEMHLLFEVFRSEGCRKSKRGSHVVAYFVTASTRPPICLGR